MRSENVLPAWQCEWRPCRYQARVLACHAVLERAASFHEGSESLPGIEILHRNYSRKPEKQDIYLLAIDHRTFFHGRDPQKVRKFKQLVVQSLEDLNLRNSGVILDESYDTSLPIFRCIEEPQKVPLKFLGHLEARLILNSWPKEHGVKVLSPITDCDDEVIDPLKQLYDACVDTHRQLLIEFVFPAFPRIADLIEKCYKQGIYPDWWKLPPFDDPAGWKRISKTIRDSDPGCRGILLLGQNRPLKELVKKHRKIKQVDEMIKGFAVGRTIWGDLAGRYFAGQIDERVSEIKSNKIFWSWSMTRMTLAQALIRYLASQKVELFDGSFAPFFGGVWGIYGHGNVAGIGEALWKYRDDNALL